MEVDETKSSLFQALLSPRDVRYFKNPESQPQYNPMNCAAVSGQLLGMIPSSTSEKMTVGMMGVHFQEWLNELNKAAGQEIYRSEQSSLDKLYNELFVGFGTLVLFTRPNVGGHYCVVTLGEDNNLYLLDPQKRKVFKNEEIPKYLQEQQLTGPIYVIKSVPRTKSPHISAFVEDILAGKLSACRVGGKRKPRRTRKMRSRRTRIRRTRKQ